MTAPLPPPEDTGLQWLFNAAGGLLALLLSALFALVQFQLQWVKDGTSEAEKRLRGDMDERFDQLDARDDERREVQAQRHADNQAEMERLRQTLIGMAAKNDQMMAKLASLPDRQEIRQMLRERNGDAGRREAGY